MGASPRRWLRGGCLTAAVLCALLAIAYPAFGQEAPAGAPEVWRGAASAGAVSMNVNRDALLPVEGVFHFITPDGDSVY